MTALLRACRLYPVCLFFVFFGIMVKTLSAADAEKPTCSLQARVFDAEGHEFLDRAAGVQVFAFLWQKIDAEERVQGTDWQPVVHCPDGSSWRRIGMFFLRDPGWTSEWPVKMDVSPGEYRFSFTVHKIFTKWEGPPGTSETTSGASHDRVTDVDGYASPKRICGWGLGDAITISADDKEKTVDLHPDDGPKVRLRTTFLPPPESTADDLETKNGLQGFRESSSITMRIFREENFSPDLFFESNPFGIPWYVDFDRMKPGRYSVHFYRGATPPETGTTAATDVFSFEVTEDGPNEFVFTPEKSLAENATWQVVGTVRDENGKPMPNVQLSASGLMTPGGDVFSVSEDASAWTDAEGKYRLILTPSPSQSGAVFDAETKRWRWEFRLQQATPRASYYRYRSLDAGTPDRKGDLILLGEFATDDLKKQLAERQEDTIPVEMNRPAIVDFTMPPRGPEIPLQELNANPERRKQRFESLESLKTLAGSDSYKLFRELVLPNSLNRNYVEATEIALTMSATLTAEQPAFLFDEPVELKWNIANGSEYDVSVMLDENMGNSTVVWATSDDGEVLLESERFGWAHSGPVYYERIGPKSSLPYEIFMPEKFAFPKPGRYTINVARSLSVQRIEPPKDDHVSWRWRRSGHWAAVYTPLFSSVTLEIVATDPVKLGEQIDELIRKIQGRKESKNYGEAEKALKRLCAIDDERVVPCLVEEIRGDNYSYAFQAIGALAKFKCDAAFEGIKKALKLSDSNLLLSAAYALQKSKHPEAIAELLKNQNHSSDSVRLIVVQSAKKMDRETALDMLRKRFDDPGGWEGSVGKEARRIYKELTDEKSEGEEDETTP